MIINQKNFEKIAKKMEGCDCLREELIRDSRDILKLSKQIVYALHRDDVKTADGLVKEMATVLNKLYSGANKNQLYLYEGFSRIAIQEYIEALAYYEFIKNNRIPDFKKEYIDEEYYLLGLCDLGGELVRSAVNAGIVANYQKILRIKQLVDELYGALIKIDFKNGELRKKFDALRWELKKLDDIVFELKLKEKV